MEFKIVQALIKEFPELKELVKKTPSTHYKVFKIPKRTIGFRTIAQPTSSLKDVQRKVVDLLLPHVKVHHAAKAYIKKCSIKDNAAVHLNSQYLLKLDFENFFNSITPIMLFKVLAEQGVSVSKSDSKILSEILFWNRSKKINAPLVLSIGAPSSPLISNIVMYSFDRKIEDICKALDINYSRYADDLTFSTNIKSVLFNLVDMVNEALQIEFEGEININSSKTVFSSKKHNRHVTGITLTNSNKLSIGRIRKRYISALVHKFKTNQLNDLTEINHLKGLLGFAYYIEPNFIVRLTKKYGSDIMIRIRKFNSEDLK
ncbi:retron St85 family RNA-directed DNA polymerase [Colwellia polaris]|uniref:retron St85 family RNA-directed DNA polymerase n=1 Tax=Colwellia polaris TaxID=326537 RepID=UPI000A16E2D2|nr:retron St85 family RNA-directed DNA polymerase [Colwellia polaris]